MRLRPGARQRRSAAAELPVRRPRRRVPAAGVQYEPRLAAGAARRRRRPRHPGRAAGAGGRLMLRDLEDLRPHEALTPRPTNSVVSRSFTGAFGLGTRTVSFRLSLPLTTRGARGSAWRDARSGGRGTAATRAA